MLFNDVNFEKKGSFGDNMFNLLSPFIVDSDVCCLNSVYSISQLKYRL